MRQTTHLIAGLFAGALMAAAGVGFAEGLDGGNYGLSESSGRFAMADGSVSAASLYWEEGTGFYQADTDEITVAINGSITSSFEAGWVIRSGGVAATGPGMVEESASSTNPTLIPRWDDLDTGVGRCAADSTAIVSGGQAAVCFAEASNEVQQTWDACTFANLGTPGNGTFCYCSDCTKATPCAGSGSGSFAKRLNGAWDCD